MSSQPMPKSTDMNFSDRLSAWAAQPDLGLEANARREARIAMVDTLACMVLGTHERQSKSAMEAMLFGLEQGSVQPVGGGAKLSLTGAALVNGTRAAALDFDDYELSGNSHASASILGALFALAQKVPLTIDQLCDAWVVGHETSVWIGRALGFGHYQTGWHSTLTLGPIATAAAVARALQLTPVQMSNAMALSVSSSSGLVSQFGYDAKALHPGIAAEAGLRAALLGQANARANRDLWDRDFGFARIYGTPESIGFHEMMKTMELGKAVALYPVVRKLWASCGYTTRAIYGAINLHGRIPSTDDIASIRIRMPEPYYRIVGFGIPTTDNEARFSIRYCVATGLLSGSVTPDDFLPEGFERPEPARLIRLTELDLYALSKGHNGDIGPSAPEKVTVTLHNGAVVEEDCLHVPGGASMPMTEVQLMQKVRDCGWSVDQAKYLLTADGSTFIQTWPLAGQT